MSRRRWEDDKRPDQQIDVEMVLEYSGESDTQNVRELVIRDEQITGFREECQGMLPQLQMLSLSNNRIKSLTMFGALTNLTELNLNFNQVSDMSMMRCQRLRRLYLSSNKMSDKSIESLPISFPVIETLCLFRNEIYQLQPALSVFRRLPKLQELDMDGNACARAKGYKHHVVRSLPRLQQLDGEKLQRLDRQLADMWFTKQNTVTKGGGRGIRRGLPMRPSTAPVGSARRTLAAAHPGAQLGARLSPEALQRGEALPDGKPVKLFRSDFLNSNPVILGYLAQNMIANPGSSSSDHHQQMEDDMNGGSGKGGFAAKMRQAAKSADDDDERRPRSSSDREDPSDPYVTIRKLLKTIELLQEEREQLNEHGADDLGGDTVDELREEARQLRLENANMYTILEENKGYRKEVDSLRKRCEQYETQLGRNGLAAENKRLRRELEDMKMKHDHMKEIYDGMQMQNELQRPRTAAQVLEECEDGIDAEVAELIRRNESTLKQLRNDVDRTKRDMLRSSHGTPPSSPGVDKPPRATRPSSRRRAPFSPGYDGDSLNGRRGSRRKTPTRSAGDGRARSKSGASDDEARRERRRQRRKQKEAQKAARGSGGGRRSSRNKAEESYYDDDAFELSESAEEVAEEPFCASPSNNLSSGRANIFVVDHGNISP